MSKAVTASVSRGTFVFPGKKKRANPKQYFPADTHTDSYSQCQQLIRDVDETVEKIQMELHSEVYAELIRYISTTHSLNGNTQSKVSVREIPTASLVTGVNQADHVTMFSQLIKLLREKVTPHIANLSAKDCNSTKAAIASVMSQLLAQGGGELEGEEDSGGAMLGRKSDHSIDVLVTWYAEQVKKAHLAKVRSSPRKRKSTGQLVTADSGPPVVVIIEDFEAFPGQVLHDVITIFSGRLCEVPLMLVFGVATAVTALHRLLPHHVSSLLCMEKFQAPPATECLSLLVEKLLMRPSTMLKLGGRVFNQLVQTFLCHDFSLTNFISSYKFAIMEHFSENPISCLCVPHCEVNSKLRHLNISELDQLRSTASFRRYVESVEPKEQIKLLEDDSYCKKEMYRMMEHLNAYHNAFFPVMRCLHTFTSDLPKHPLGKHLRELYGECLSSTITHSMDYSDSISLIRTLCQDELKNKLSKCSDLLDNNIIPACLQTLKSSLDEFTVKFTKLEEFNSGEDSMKVEITEEEDTLVLPRMDVTTLKKTLQEKKKKKMSAYDVLRHDCVDYLDSVFRKHLVSPRSYPLFETSYYSNWAHMHQHINGCPRVVVQRGLTNPFHYLMHPDTQRTAGLIPPTLPDLCIVYLLHLECGRRINLYDWLESFHTIISAGTDEEDSQLDKVTQARFIQAVSELQFLGFIKPTKQKTDHVARLTWGGC